MPEMPRHSLWTQLYNNPWDIKPVLFLKYTLGFVFFSLDIHISAVFQEAGRTWMKKSHCAVEAQNTCKNLLESAITPGYFWLVLLLYSICSFPFSYGILNKACSSIHLLEYRQEGLYGLIWGVKKLNKTRTYWLKHNYLRIQFSGLGSQICSSRIYIPKHSA